MGGSETAQQPDKQLNERGGIGRQHVSDDCVTDAVSQCHSVRACPSANGHSLSFGILLPINKECRFDELLVRFRRWDKVIKREDGLTLIIAVRMRL